MARGEGISMDSSEMAVVLDDCDSSINEEVPIDPPETSSLTAMPDVRQPLTELPTAENNSESKWKPLIGTPSKSPIPENIFVPDPSPARTISDTASTIMPALSTPDSFVHRRRQGEYVPRPPIWTVYNMDGTTSTSVNPPDLMNLANNNSEETLSSQFKCAPMLKHENRRLSKYNLSFSDIKLQGVGLDQKVMKMGEVFVDRPLVVNMMHLTGPQTLPQPKLHRVPSGTEASVTRDSEVREDCSSVPNPDPAEQGCTRENTEYGPAERFVAATTDYTPSYSPEDPDIILDQPRHLAPGDENQPADDLITDSIASDVPQEPPYAIMEGPGRSIERLPRYVDLRVRLTQDQPNPLMNYMTVGSFITYVGLTRFPDSITGIAREFELPLNSRYLVADIYGDYWGLLIRLERGLELGEIQPTSFLGRKSKPRAPERMRYPERTRLIGVRTDPKYIVYAPLCAFTLTANEGTAQSQTEPESSNGSVSTASHGRLAQAAIRSYSNDAEAEAVMDRFTFIPKTVYRQYVAYFARSRARHDAVTDRPQRPSSTENRKPSGRSRAPALKSSTGTIKTAKNTPTQNIKDLFMRKKDTNVVCVSSSARFDDIAAPGRAIHGICDDGSCSPRFVAARAPQIPSLPSSFQSLSLGPPDEPFDAPPSYLDSNRRRDSSSLRVRDTNLRSIPLPPDDSLAISRQDERQSSAEISDPMTNPQSHNTDQKMSKRRGSKHKRTQNGSKSSKFDAVTRNATVTVRKLMPALLGGFSKPLANNTAWKESAEHKSFARQRLIGPYKHAARSWREFKEKRHQRKPVLPQFQDRPSSPSNLSNEFVQGRGGDQILPNHQQPSIGDENADRRMQIALMHALTTDADAPLERRLDTPMPTRSNASDADDEYQSESAQNVGPEVSTHTLPAPGRLGDHLFEIAPDRIVRDRLTASVEQLVG